MKELLKNIFILTTPARTGFFITSLIAKVYAPSGIAALLITFGISSPPLIYTLGPYIGLSVAIILSIIIWKKYKKKGK